MLLADPKQILIIAPPDDVHGQAVAASLVRDLKVEPILWDSGLECSFRRVSFDGTQFSIDIGGTVLQQSDIGAIWWRRQRRVVLPRTVYDPQAKRHINDAHNSILYALLYAMGSKVLNPLSASNQADEKAYQLDVARQCGLDIPKTLISNTLTDILAFANNLETIVTKPLVTTLGCFGEARVIDAEVVRQQSEDIQIAPTIFQEVIEPATDLRVTIVDKDLFAARIVKNNPIAEAHVDWRLDPSTECIAVELPICIKDRLLLLMQRLGLKYGAIDIRHTPDDRYIFLEVNTSGQYLWVEVDTKQPITNCIAKLLVRMAEGAAK